MSRDKQTEIVKDDWNNDAYDTITFECEQTKGDLFGNLIVCKMGKQKLANDIYKICPELAELGESNWTYLDRLANRLYDTYGYRKSTDLAEEIFAEIDKLLAVDRHGEATLDVRVLAELKKKYTEEGK